MISLTKTSLLIRKLQPFLLFGLALGLILIIIYIRYLKPPPPKPPLPVLAPSIQQDPRQKSPDQVNFDQDTQFENLISETPVYKKLPVTLNENEAQEFANKFGFENKPTTKEQGRYYWTAQDKELLVNSLEIVYKKKFTDNNKILTQETLLNLSQEFIDKNKLTNYTLNYNKQKTAYYSYKNDLETVGDFNGAQVVEFSFDRIINNLPLLDNTPYTSTLIVRIKKDGEIIFFSNNHYENIEEQSTYDLISKEEFVKLLKEDKGKIVQSLLLDQYGQALKTYQFEPQQIKSVTITNAYIAYFASDDPIALIQPVWVAEGSFVKADQQGKVIIFLPAIKNLTNPKP